MYVVCVWVYTHVCVVCVGVYACMCGVCGCGGALPCVSLPAWERGSVLSEF